MRLSDAEREEFKALAASESLRADMAQVAALRHDPLVEDDAEAYIEFLTNYNEFLNHPIKPFQPFIEENMKL